MRNGFRSILGLAIAMGCCAAGEPGGSDPPLTRMAEAERPDWSRTPDFDALRKEYGDRDDFRDLCEKARPLRAAFDAVAAEDWVGTLAIADGWLPRCPVDIDLHMLRAVALARLDRAEESEQQIRWRDGLVGSVLRSGDGRTPETAWVVISIDEEYSILRVLGLKRQSQALTREGLDRLEVEREGERHVVYFDPAAHFRRLEKLLGVAE